MGRFVPIRNLAGNIIGTRPFEEPDPVQATLSESMQALGATTAQPDTKPAAPQNAQTTMPKTRPPAMLATMILVFGTIAIALFRSGSGAPERQDSVVMPTTAPSTPTVKASPTSAAPTAPPAEGPSHADGVTLAPIVLYGDYDEVTKIGPAPEGLSCLFFGQSPDAAWVWLDCPSPTGRVWAKVADLKLSETQRAAVSRTQIVYRPSATAPPQEPIGQPAAPPPAPVLRFCADRFALYGKTHQCAATQAEADALADAEITRINTEAQAKRGKP